MYIHAYMFFCLHIITILYETRNLINMVRKHLPTVRDGPQYNPLEICTHLNI